MVRRRMCLILILVLFSIPAINLLTANISQAQEAANSERDLWGSNIGHSILLKWLTEPNATEYIVYRGTSSSGPWTELFRDEDIAVGGMRQDVTPDAKVMDLCYKVEAVDGSGQVIRNYEAMCVPKFVE